MTDRHRSFLSAAGAVMLLAGAVLQMTRLAWTPYVYLAGALLFAYVQVTDGYDGRNIVIRRLRRQQLAGAVLLVAAGVMMILWHHNEWVACLTIAAVLELYTAFRIPQEEERERRKS